MTSEPPFSSADVFQLLTDTVGDETLLADRVGTWLEERVAGPADGHSLLFTIAYATATAMGVEATADEYIAIQTVSTTGSEVDWGVRISAQLVTAAANRDDDMLHAICMSVLRQDNPEASIGAFMDALIPLLRLFRAAALARDLS